MIELGDNAKLICARNYNTNCGGCELRSACVSSVKNNDKWVKGVNELADIVMKGASKDAE